MSIKLITNSILFILIIISGIWMSKLGKPYNSMVFNIHKFIALAFIAYSVILSREFLKTIQMSSLHWLLLVISIIFVLAILVSGGILSSKQEIVKPLFLIHKLSSGFALFSIIGWFYICLKN